MSVPITPSIFTARYKLACFYIANHLFENVVANSSEIDLSHVKKLQRDDGFFMSSLRIVEQLTALTSPSEIELLQRKIEATGTMYFKKSILTAVVKQGATTTAENEAEGKKAKQENLYDKFFVKKLYDSYFSAYVDDEPLEFLDKPDPKQSEDLVSIYELGVFDSDTLNTISEILDFTTPVGALNANKALMNNSRYTTYKQFFVLVSKFL